MCMRSTVSNMNTKLDLESLIAFVLSQELKGFLVLICVRTLSGPVRTVSGPCPDRPDLRKWRHFAKFQIAVSPSAVGNSSYPVGHLLTY